jgi:hypothetical protein
MNYLNKELLISLLNNLLEFTNNNEIIEVELNSNELPVSMVSSEKSQTGGK